MSEGDVKGEKGRLVVITGLPGSGKTTLALALASDADDPGNTRATRRCSVRH